MEVTAELFTAAAENAAWKSDAHAAYHEMGEELVRQAAAPLLLMMDVCHLKGPRIAGEIQAKAHGATYSNGAEFVIRRSFAGVGAEMEIRIGYETAKIPNGELCNMELVRERVREMARKQGFAAF